ncbi:MAG: hypothetical protein ACKOKE_07260 [Actinomycetota bacterium]
MRRRLPADLEAPFAAFGRVAAAIERGQRALLASVPNTRLPGRPLADTLVAYEEALEDAAASMEAWRAPAVAPAWSRAAAGLATARDLARRIRLEAPEPEGFEALVGTIGDLLAPLDAFHDAEEAFARLRRWRR